MDAPGMGGGDLLRFELLFCLECLPPLSRLLLWETGVVLDWRRWVDALVES